MHEKDSGILDGLLTPCGHRNPPSAHFCDVCGVKLPMQCPCCHAINRRQANFCNNCGIGLRDERQTHATPSIGPFGPSPDSSHAIASDSAPAPPKLFVPAQPAATEGSDAPDSFDPFPWTAKRGRPTTAAGSSTATSHSVRDAPTATIRRKRISASASGSHGAMSKRWAVAYGRKIVARTGSSSASSCR